MSIFDSLVKNKQQLQTDIFYHQMSLSKRLVLYSYNLFKFLKRPLQLKLCQSKLLRLSTTIYRYLANRNPGVIFTKRHFLRHLRMVIIS
jgi:hypothetical protein